MSLDWCLWRRNGKDAAPTVLVELCLDVVVLPRSLQLLNDFACDDAWARARQGMAANSIVG